MRKLTNDDLWQLESMIDDGVRYLFLRDDETSMRYLRMYYPSRIQERKARLEQHKYKSLIGAEPGMQTRRQVERENKLALAEINKEMNVLQQRMEVAQRNFIENDLSMLPDGQDDPEGFVQGLQDNTVEIQEIIAEITKLDATQREILSFCIEELALQHFIERLAQMCWEQRGDNDTWEPIWTSWEEFESDHNQIVNLLIGETRLWIMGGVPFFASPPQLPTGDNDT